MNINWETVIVACIPLVIAVFTYIANKRSIDASTKSIEKKSKADEFKSIVDGVAVISKVSTDLLTEAKTDWQDRLSKQDKECAEDKDKLRQDLAAALVENADLKTELARLNGYVQGITDPLIKLEEAQKAALKGGRRATDQKP